MARGPGSQTRRHGRWYAGGVGYCLAAALFLAGLGAYGVASPGVAPRWVFAAIFGGLALLFLLAAWGAHLRRRPRRAGAFRVVATPQALRRGDDVQASLEVTATVRGPLRVGLVLLERYDVMESRTDGEHTYEERVTREARAHEDWRDADGAPGEQRFRFSVPAGAPYSHEGDAVSWIWVVEAREQAGRRRDAVAQATLQVAP
ncbi:MAG: hypothetical protein MUE51_15670 [Thermoleophilia bacterium]|jgi:hypothetical protein|nr:hypothetical protein [Thermoleophilia bacterium]